MKKRIISFLVFILLKGFSVNSIAQTESYNDVLLVVNSASGISDSVGQYFANAREIPEQNIVRVSAPMTEEIDSLQFEMIRQQIESALISRKLQDSINYIVTTKGMPLKVMRVTAYANSSFENELALILGPYASYIGKVGKIPSPYYKKRENFTRAKYGFYIVTRLDGYTFHDVKGLIDRSSMMPASISSTSQFVLDMDPLWTTTPALNNNMRNVADSLRVRGISSCLDTTTTFMMDKTNVLGYVSFGSNDYSDQLYTTNAKPRNTYVPGAIAETYVSTSARSFALPATYGQSLIADLIAEGVTAVKGYVYEPYSNAMADVSVLFPMYVDGFTVGESFYSASLFLSWMDVVIGDPKFRLVSSRLPSDSKISQPGDTTALPVELSSFTAIAKGSGAKLTWATVTETHNYGFEIERRSVPNGTWNNVGFIAGAGTSNSPRDYFFADIDLSAGTYAYRIKQLDNDGAYQYSTSAEIEIVGIPAMLKLVGNFPNPFNPTTKIRFSVPATGNTQLKIYNIVGQEVATVFHGIAYAGNLYEPEFNASGLSSGLYFSVLEYGGQRLTHKMVLAK
jgi:uncharacterized protein (TIGR03790 family)